MSAAAASVALHEGPVHDRGGDGDYLLYELQERSREVVQVVEVGAGAHQADLQVVVHADREDDEEQPLDQVARLVVAGVVPAPGHDD